MATTSKEGQQVRTFPQITTRGVSDEEITMQGSFGALELGSVYF